MKLKGCDGMSIYAKMGDNKCVQSFGAEKSWEGNINMAHSKGWCMDETGSGLFANGGLLY